MATSNPTSLLWAHQLKREHAFLLKRMQDLESGQKIEQKRQKSAEGAAKSATAIDIATLRTQLAEMEKHFNERLDGIDIQGKAMTGRLDEVQQSQSLAAKEKTQLLAKEITLLKRIAEVEAGLSKYRASQEQLGKRIDHVLYERTKSLLEGLTAQVEVQGSEMEGLKESIVALDKTQAQLLRANEKLEKQIKKVELKPETSAGAVKDLEGAEKTVDADLVPVAAQDAKQPQSKKKSHKWVGGGADRDIIQQGSELGFTTRSCASRPAPAPAFTSKAQNTTQRKQPAPPKYKAKKKVPPRGQDGSSSTKSHKWSGGGADRSVIAAGASDIIGEKRRRSSSAVLEPSPKRRRCGSESEDMNHATIVPDGPRAVTASKGAPPVKGGVVRKGKDWIEVAHTPSLEDDSDAKGGGGRPRKQVQEPTTAASFKDGRHTDHDSTVEVNETQTTHDGLSRKLPAEKDSLGTAIVREEAPLQADTRSIPLQLFRPPRPQTIADGPNNSAIIKPTSAKPVDAAALPTVVAPPRPPRRTISQYDGSCEEPDDTAAKTSPIGEGAVPGAEATA